MAKIKILVEGSTTADNPGAEEKTCATITLIQSGDLNIVVDPGVLEEQELLIGALAKENLSVGDIDIVCVTHSHFDHYRNVGMFSKAKNLEFYGMWDGGKNTDCGSYLTPEIEIVKTPGHSSDSLTFMVKTADGIVAVCGDVFWKENFPDFDPYANDTEKLRESRKKVLSLADWVIPGHGPMFKSPKFV